MEKVEFAPLEGVKYKYRYLDIFKAIANYEGSQDEKLAFERSQWRFLIKNDLWFILNFVLRIPKVNHQFIIDNCWEVETGAKSNTLDIWAREHFKDLDVTTPILTTTGWKAHGDLLLGDLVYTPTGNTAKVVATKHFNGNKCYEMNLCNNIKIISGENHSWKVELPCRDRVPGTFKTGISCGKRNTRKEVIMTTEQLSQIVNKFKYKIGIKITEPLINKERELPIDPYLLGAWLGDGYSSLGAICGIDKDIFREIEKRGYKIYYRKKEITRHPDYEVIRIEGLTSLLRKNNLLQNKHIPVEYLIASEKQRRDLLWGLMDTDGTISSTRNATATFTNSNKLLADQFRTLANSLGYKARITPMRTMNSWQVCFQVYSDDKHTPCFLQRKINLLKKGIKRHKASKTWYINSINEVSSRETNCITIDNPEGMYLAGEQLTPTHNSSIITIAETIQYILAYPEKCTAIFCYVRDRAEKFLFAIKETLTNNKLLLQFFPDILYQNPEREAPIWSIEKGIVVKRKNSRPEPTVGAYGLIEGMPTSVHFDRRVYDDIITQDICENYETMEKVKLKYDMSQSLGKDGGVHRVVGTYYAYDDPLVYIREKKYIYDSSKPIYQLRLKPATVDGTPNGKSIFVSDEYLNELKSLKSFNSQYLLNPSPTETKKLNKDCLKVVKPGDMPERLFKFLLIDPSGKKGTGDPVAILLIGVNPDKDDNGASNIYILNAVIEKYPLPEFIAQVVTMYKNGGKILRICVEEVGQSTTEVHIREKLNAMGYSVSIENDTIQIYKPSKRAKTARIEELSVPLINGKIHISTAVPQKYIDIIRKEMEDFPFSNDDHAIDILSYFVIDTLPDYQFPKVYTNIRLSKPIPAGAFN